MLYAHHHLQTGNTSHIHKTIRLPVYYHFIHHDHYLVYQIIVSHEFTDRSMGSYSKRKTPEPSFLHMSTWLLSVFLQY